MPTECSLPSAASAEKDRQWVAQGKQLAETALQRAQAAADAVVELWEAESTRKWLQTWYIKLLAAAALALGLATAVVNLWAVRSINANLLPQASVAASRMLQRDVSSPAPLPTCVPRTHPCQPCGAHGLCSRTALRTQHPGTRPLYI